MAVTKMRKLTVIAGKKKAEAILQTLQGIQKVDIRDLKIENKSNQWVKEFFEEKQQAIATQDLTLLQQQQNDIQEAIRFIENYGEKDKSSYLQRQNYSLQEFEEKFDATTFEQNLAEVFRLKDHWQELMKQQERLTAEESWLTFWQALDVYPTNAATRQTELVLATVAMGVEEQLFDDLKQMKNIYFENLYPNTSQNYLALLFPKNMTKEVNQLFQRYSVVKADYPFELPPKEMLKKIKTELTEVVAALQKSVKEIGEKRAWIREFQWADEVLLSRMIREGAKDKVLANHHYILLQGWVGIDDESIIIKECTQQLGENECYISFEEPSEVEIVTEVPTKLSNHPMVAPFEMLTEMYALPKYHEIDPTPWFVPFYLVFFGMMVADAGYGLLMLVATTVALKTKILPRSLNRFMKFFQILALPTIAWGLIYNSFFGFSLGYSPILSTSDDVISILIISVIFGFIQIMVGLGLAAVENIKAKNYVGAVSSGFAWQGIFAGIIVAAAGKMLLASQALFYVGVGISVICAILIMVLPAIGAQSKGAALAGGAYDLYGITGYIGDLVSYTRLMALGISGGSIAAAFNMLVNYMPTGARFTVGIILMVALHGLNIFLSLLSAYVHGARLQYVEFFGKFYEGGGKPFAPLKTEEKYINIQQKEK